MSAAHKPLLLAGAALALLGFASAVRAAPPRPRGAGAAASSQAAARARKLLQQGMAALAVRRFAGAEAVLADSYRAQPSAEALFYLGALALAEGRLLDAQDLMRRFVVDPRLGVAADSPEVQEAQRILLQEGPPHGQLNVVGEAGTMVLVDGRLRGSLPLSRPLLVAPGERRVTLLHGARQQEMVIPVSIARYFELRHSASSGAMVVLQFPGVLLLSSYVDAPDDLALLVFHALEPPLLTENYSLLQRSELTLGVDDKQLPGCLEQAACPTRLGEQTGVELVLAVRAQRQDAGWHLRLQLLDVQIGDLAASSEQVCSGCSPQQLASVAAKALLPLLARARGRARATLHVESTPSGAEVRVGERLLGSTPLTRPQWVGDAELAVSLVGYQSQVRSLHLSAGQTTDLRLELAPVPVEVPATPPPPPPLPVVVIPPPAPVTQERRPAPRPAGLPRWRLGSGIAALTVGSVVLGFGVSGLYAASQCAEQLPAPDGLCLYNYSTLPPGVSLTAVGGALLLTGVGLLAIPASRTPAKDKSHAPESAATGTVDARL